MRGISWPGKRGVAAAHGVPFAILLRPETLHARLVVIGRPDISGHIIFFDSIHKLFSASFTYLPDKPFGPAGKLIQITGIQQLLVDQAAADPRNRGAFANEVSRDIQVDTANRYDFQLLQGIKIAFTNPALLSDSSLSCRVLQAALSAKKASLSARG